MLGLGFWGLGWVGLGFVVLMDWGWVLGISGLIDGWFRGWSFG